MQADVGDEEVTEKTAVFWYALCVPSVTQLPLYTLGSVPLNSQHGPVHVGALFVPLQPLTSMTLHVGDALHRDLQLVKDIEPALTAVEAMPCEGGYGRGQFPSHDSALCHDGWEVSKKERRDTLEPGKRKVTHPSRAARKQIRVPIDALCRGCWRPSQQ